MPIATGGSIWRITTEIKVKHALKWAGEAIDGLMVRKAFACSLGSYSHLSYRKVLAREGHNPSGYQTRQYPYNGHVAVLADLGIAEFGTRHEVSVTLAFRLPEYVSHAGVTVQIRVKGVYGSRSFESGGGRQSRFQGGYIRDWLDTLFHVSSRRADWALKSLLTPISPSSHPAFSDELTSSI